MVRVMDLYPGDALIMSTPDGKETGIFIGTIKPHPLYPSNFWMVIWWMVERKEWSMDALMPVQGLPGRIDAGNRESNLRAALQPKS